MTDLIPDRETSDDRDSTLDPTIVRTLTAIETSLAKMTTLVNLTAKDAQRSFRQTERILDRIATALEAIAARTPTEEYINRAAVRALELAYAGELVPPAATGPASLVTQPAQDPVIRSLDDLFQPEHHSSTFRSAMAELATITGASRPEMAQLIRLADDRASSSSLTVTRVGLAMRDLALSGATVAMILGHYQPVSPPPPETVPTDEAQAPIKRWGLATACDHCDGNGLLGARVCTICDGTGLFGTTRIQSLTAGRDDGLSPRIIRSPRRGIAPTVAGVAAAGRS